MASRWIDIVDDELGQTPLLIVHCNILLVAIETAVNPVVCNVGVVIVAPPEINVHSPVPVVGLFPFRVAVVAHIVWFIPALAVVGDAVRVIVTWLILGVQLPLDIVHLKTLAPIPKAVTPDVADVGVVIAPAPLIKVHSPVPTVAVFPANITVVAHTD